MISFSIVIPVFNVENYLNKCLDSVLEQVSLNDEIILVNDGSTDNSQIICKNYSDRYSIIKLIIKSNGGLSDARNVGIKCSIKDYIIFIDSDDSLISGSLNNLRQILSSNNIEILSYNAKIVFENCQGSKLLLKNMSISNDIVNGLSYLKSSIIKNSFNVCAWLYAYNRNFIMENEFLFKKGILHEDIDWTIRVLLKCTKLLSVDICTINYLKRVGSITVNSNLLRNSIDITNTIKNLLRVTYELDDKNARSIINDYLVNIYMYSFYQVPNTKLLTHTLSKKQILFSAYFFKTKIKCLLFVTNLELYLFLYKKLIK